jgi:hypothetical protein
MGMEWLATAAGAACRLCQHNVFSRLAPVAAQIARNLRHLANLRNIVAMFAALLHNPHIFVEPYVGIGMLACVAAMPH